VTVFVLTALLAFALAHYLAPPIIAAAHRYGILDHGDGRLKEQKQPVAYLGGLVVFLGMLAAVAVTQEFDERMLALLLGASLIVSVGLVDDLGTLTPKDKFLGQVLAGTIMVKGGISIQLGTLPGVVGQFASVLWMVSIINAFNIIDVSDGLCAGVGAVASLLMGGWLLLHGARPEAFLCAALFGSLMAFLRYNWQPARMYLGDTGSMLVGTVLGASVMMAPWSERNSVAALVSPLGVLVVPLFDITFVVCCRLILGLRIYHGSPDHFAVRLRRHGWAPRRVGMLAMGLTALGGGLGLLAAWVDGFWALAVGSGGLVLCIGSAFWLWRFDPRKPSVASTTPAVAQPEAASAPPKESVVG
jgi:UDP-GlcNAc:undecaprenyl-phosphate GlcNAc-1-phosphate transferase